MTGHTQLPARSPRRRPRSRRLNSELLETRYVLACTMIQAGFYDFGDLPDPDWGTGNQDYQTTGHDHGPSHALAGPRLGTWRDPENMAQPELNASEDDSCHPDGYDIDDEDGIAFPATMIRDATVATTGSMYVDLQEADSTSNKLDAWIDFNKDGDFADTGEQIFDTYSLGTTDSRQLLNFTIPAGSIGWGHFYGRFRLSTQGGLTPQFFFWDGEVEDHVVPIEGPNDADLTVDMELLESPEVTISKSSGNLLIESDGETLMEAPLASAQSLTIEGTYFTAETVVIDVTGGVPVPANDMVIDLRNYAVNNKIDNVHIVGTLDSSLDPNYTFTSEYDGEVRFYDGTTLEHEISFENVETVADVSSGTGVSGTVVRTSIAQRMTLSAGTAVDGITTTKITSYYDDIPDLLVGAKPLEIVTGSYADIITLSDTAGITGLTLTTGAGNDKVGITKIASTTTVNANTGDDNDTIYLGVNHNDPNLDSTGSLSNLAGSLEIDTGSNTLGSHDLLYVRDMSSTEGHTYEVGGSLLSREAGSIEIGLANLEALDFRIGDHADQVTVNDTDDLASFYLQTGNGNDIVSVLAVDSGTEAEIDTNELNDLVYLGIENGDPNVNSGGDLSNILGAVSVDMGTSMVGYVDAINIRDMDSATGQTYDIDATSLSRVAGGIEIELANLERFDLRTGSNPDVATINGTGDITSLYLQTGDGNDVVSALAIDSGTDAEIRTNELNDLVFVGVEYGGDINGSGDLTPIAGELLIDGGSNMVGYVDAINIRDMDSATGQTYDIDSTSLSRVAGDIEIEFANLERFDLRTGSNPDVATVNGTGDITSFYLKTGGGNDVVSVLAIDAETDAEIDTNERNDLVFVGVEYGGDVNGSGDLTPIAGELLIDGGSSMAGYSDAINIRDIDATSNHTYGLSNDILTRDTSVEIEIMSFEWVDLRTGSGDDTVSNAIVYAAGFYAHGGNGNDTLTGGSGADSFSGGNGNDTLSGGDGDDSLWLGTGADTASGGAGDDYFHAGNVDSAVDSIFGDLDTDEIVGSLDLADLLTSIELDNRT